MVGGVCMVRLDFAFSVYYCFGVDNGVVIFFFLGGGRDGNVF